jgi:D-cysteine desulfhydrase family pyridoxal phosphate-dependent enzyme
MKNLPRLLFAHLPTPVEPLANLSAYLKGPALWIKRDDQTGLAFGGNKTRKLEFLVAEAVAHGAKTLVTGGAVQSNHCRQTAATACRFGLDCVLVLGHSESSLHTDKYNGNLLLDRLLGAEIVWTTRDNRDQSLKETFEHLWQQGRRPYLIPYGGSNATGALGYAQAIQELITQLSNDTNIPMPNTIVFASSSGGTQAGLVAGKLIYKFPTQILGISIDEEEDILQRRVAKLVSEVCDLLGEKFSPAPESILVNSDYLGAGYGVMGEAEKEAIQLFARKEAIILDPVYTGRAAAGLIDLISKRYFDNSENILFWHTGGGPALFADPYRNEVL